MRRYFSPRLVRWWKDSAGASMVEAALITPLLLLLTFSIVDFASLFYAYLALENGVTQAARYGVTGAIIPGQSREQSIMSAMRDATPTLAIDDAAFSFAHLPRGTAVWQPGSGDPSDISKVTVTYTWALFTPLVRVMFPGGQLQIKVESAMMNEPRFD